MKPKAIAIWLGLLLLVSGAMLAWWAFGGNSGPEIRSVNLSVVGQTLYGAGPGGTIRVRQGDEVALRLTSDEPMEVFLHGYDLDVWVEPGTASTVQFKANVLGRFALMIHSLRDDGGSHQAWKRVEVLLGFIEVSPKK